MTLTRSIRLLVLSAILLANQAPCWAEPNQPAMLKNPFFGRSGLRVYAFSGQSAYKSSVKGNNSPTVNKELDLRKLDSQLWNNNICFYLPKHVLDLHLKWKCNELNGLPVEVDAASECKFSIIQDNDLGFRADYRNALGTITDVKECKLEIDDRRILKSVSGQQLDQTAPAVADVAYATLKIAKAASIAAASGTALEREANFQAEINANDATEVTHKLNFLDSYNQSETIESGWLVEPEALKAKHFALHIDKELVKNASSSSLLSGHYINGFIVRNPEPKTRVRLVCKSGENSYRVLFDTQLQLAQTGSFVFVPVRRYMLREVSTSFTLNESGAITSINETNTSWVKTLTGALRSATEALP